ncbi:MAG: hypothetical protein HYX90_09810 [Chloroflexi bacterium]|nr:hypothetical protein [Chloroflexota bacterium]
MDRKYKILVAGLGAVAILTMAVATTAFAARAVSSASSTAAPAAAVDVAAIGTPTDADYQAWGCPVAGGSYEAVAKLLGLTTQEIEAQLAQGKSLVEIAKAKGVTEDQLVAAILVPMKEFMQKQVTAGNWTQQQLDERLKLAEQHIRQLVNAKGDVYGGCGGMMGGVVGSGATPGTVNSSYGPGGMMGGGYGGMMGGGWSGGGMMGGRYW